MGSLTTVPVRARARIGLEPAAASIRAREGAERSHSTPTLAASQRHPGPQLLTRRLGMRRVSCGCRIEPRQNWRIHFSWVGVAEVIQLSIGYVRPSPR